MSLGWLVFWVKHQPCPGPSRHMDRVQKPEQIPWVQLGPKLQFVLTPQLSHGGGCFERGCLIFALSCTTCLGLKAAVARLFPKGD